MPELSRRRFLTRSSLGLSAAAMAGALVAAPHLLPSGAPAPAPSLGLGTPPVPPGAIVLHVRDVAAGEVSLLVGTTETIYRDRELVARLVGASARAARGGR